MMVSPIREITTFKDGSFSIKELSGTPQGQRVEILPLNDFVSWQNTILASNPNMRRVRKWGDPAIGKDTGDLDTASKSNFQAIALYNDGNNTFQGVSNWIELSRGHIDRLANMQIEDSEYSLDQKMRWLYKEKGTIYFGGTGEWKTTSLFRWGTIALGGNLVRVEDVVQIKTTTPFDSRRIVRDMAKLSGFVDSDWNRPIAELLATGRVHRGFSAYSGATGFGDSPKGITYTPFWSPVGRRFTGGAKPTAFYLPMSWLE